MGRQRENHAQTRGTTRNHAQTHNGTPQHATRATRVKDCAKLKINRLVISVLKNEVAHLVTRVTRVGVVGCGVWAWGVGLWLGVCWVWRGCG